MLSPLSRHKGVTAIATFQHSDELSTAEVAGTRNHLSNLEVAWCKLDVRRSAQLCDAKRGRNISPFFHFAAWFSAGLLGLIGSMGGATAEQLAANLGLPPGHAGVASALDQASWPIRAHFI